MEVDILVESNGSLIPIEVKLSATPRPELANSIKTLKRDLGEHVLPGYVIHPGDIQLPLGEGVTAQPFANV